MASSLEELLAEEGFAEKSLRKSRGSFKSYAMSMPNSNPQEKRDSNSDFGGPLRNASKRPLFRCSSSGRGFRTRGKIQGLKEGDTFTNSEKIYKGSSKESMKKPDGQEHTDVIKQTQGIEGEYSISSEKRNEIFKDIYSNEVHIRHGMEDEAREEEHYKERPGKNVNVERRQGNSWKKNLFQSINFHHTNKTTTKLPESFYGESNDSSRGRKSFEDNHNKGHGNCVALVSIPALDVVAVQAMVSIINGHLKHFLLDRDLRLTLRHSCFTLLNLAGVEGHNTGEIITILEQAIGLVEEAVEGLSSGKDLKKVSFQLRMIAGLNTNTLKDGFTSGISNSKLSACAHLYLSMIFKLQKKENSSARHILQVFSDLPFQARTVLLPELWEILFLPHLSHIKAWYNHEADILEDSPSQLSNLKLLDKVYHEVLDSGTYKFAVYYKDWLEGIEAPAPSIAVPNVDFVKVDQESPLDYSNGTTAPGDSPSPHLRVSKKLYDAVFGASKNHGAPDTESEWESENFENCVKHFNSSNVSKHTQKSDTTKDTDQDTDEDSMGSTLDEVFPSENCKAQEWKTYDVNILSEMDDTDEFSNSPTWKKTDMDSTILHTQLHAKENDCTLKRFARSSFQVKHTDGYGDKRFYDSSNFSKASLNSIANPTKSVSYLKELSGSYEYHEEISSVLSIPRDFICPLTGQLFEDPVTLESGQSFEKGAIKAWFDQEHRTCPVTGKKLESLAVPPTNFILKRVINNWNSNRRRNVLNFLSQIVDSSGKCGIKDKNETAIFVLEQFLIACGKSQAKENAKYLLTHGYLQFLIQMFESGKLEEQTRILALLSCCIEVDTQCINHIANEISKNCLVNVLHSKQSKSLESAVKLLTKLICFGRRKDVTLFLSGLLNEASEHTLRALFVYLHDSPIEQKPFIAVLILHFNQAVESLQQNIFVVESLDAITNALDVSLTNEKVRESCCKAILLLGGHLSIPGKLERILKEAGFIASVEVNSLDCKEEPSLMDNKISLDDDDKQPNEEWLRNLTFFLIKRGKRSFLGIISKCLASGNFDLVGVGLATLTWLSFSLPLLSAPEFQPLALSMTICQLKDCLRNSTLVDHKILASICLLNFCKISECRLLVIAMCKEIENPLRSIAEVTHTAKKLYATITGRDM